MSTCKMLSLDGAGYRGVVSDVLIEALVDSPHNFAMDDVAAMPELEAVARRVIDSKAFEAAARFVEVNFR